LARKPLVGTVAENVLTHGTGALHIDACRIACGTEHMRGEVGPKVSESVWKTNSGFAKPFVATDSPLGRWPANVLHDGSDEVVGMFPQTSSGMMTPKNTRHTDGSPNGIYGKFDIEHPLGTTFGDSGSAARFFYSPKADVNEREMGLDECEERLMDESREPNSAGGSNPRNRGAQNARKNYHPTVKPVKLMEWLIRLITPKNGVVLDPFMGSGTTGIAAKNVGLSFIGIEISEEYAVIAKKRFGAAQPPLASFVAIEEVSRPSPQRTL